MSLAALEAMAAGLPLVVTRTGGTAELVEHGVNGYDFNWGDIETLTKYLRVLAKDRALVRRMGAASRDRARTYSWNVIAAQFLALFHEESLNRSTVGGNSCCQKHAVR